MFVNELKPVSFCLVHPDPPVDLTWTLLNVSLTSSYFDVLLKWMPPRSADVEMGWMTLQYEVQYRDNSSEKWTVVGNKGFSLPSSYTAASLLATVQSCGFFCPRSWTL